MVQTFLFLVETGILYEFSVVKNQDSETHYHSAKLAEREWVSCNLWGKTQTVSFACCDLDQR